MTTTSKIKKNQVKRNQAKDYLNSKSLTPRRAKEFQKEYNKRKKEKITTPFSKETIAAAQALWNS